jgi:quercetin dioxygenase-like cupin family protein
LRARCEDAAALNRASLSPGESPAIQGGNRMKISKPVLGIVLPAALALAGTWAAIALPAAGKSGLQSERVLLENDRVRVLEYTSRPEGGVCGVDRHSHPAHVTIILEPGRDRVTLDNGKVEEADLKVGDVFWSAGETHTDRNIGKTSSRLIVVELK